MRLRNAIKNKYTTQTDIQETMTYFLMAKEMGLSPKQVDEMDCVMVDEWRYIMGEMGSE